MTARPRSSMVWPLPVAILVCCLLFPGLPAAARADDLDDSALVALGQRIYARGILPSGQALRGEGRPGVVRSGADAACTACHRRSGYGMTEGPLAIRPITRDALFQTQTTIAATPRIEHQLGQTMRSPYDDQSLMRAIREGINVDGHLLNEGMPRYALRDEEIKSLLAYLKTLSSRPDPAVSETEIHLATVIQPDMPPAQRQAMLDVLSAFVQDKNAGTRSDEKRRQVGTMRMQRAYRQWRLHIWELSGPPGTWESQLEGHYRQQPVFAIVGGLGTRDWEPVQAFSERFSVPCIFPQVDLPGQGGENFYTLYLSRGVLLEADVLARYLADHPESGKLIQVYRRNSSGEEAAREFRARLPDAGSRLDDLIVDGAPGKLWADPLLARERSNLILWLDAADLEESDASLSRGDKYTTVYLSSTLLGDRIGAVQRMGIATSTLLVSPWDDPEARKAAQTRTRLWLQRKGLAELEDPIQFNTFFALNIAGDVLSHILDNFSREYFIERVEHAVQQSLVPSSFPHVSLGPNQRFAAKGSYIVQLDPDGFTAVSGWIVP